MSRYTGHKLQEIYRRICHRPKNPTQGSRDRQHGSANICNTQKVHSKVCQSVSFPCNNAEVSWFHMSNSPEKTPLCLQLECKPVERAWEIHSGFYQEQSDGGPVVSIHRILKHIMNGKSCQSLLDDSNWWRGFNKQQHITKTESNQYIANLFLNMISNVVKPIDHPENHNVYEWYSQTIPKL